MFSISRLAIKIYCFTQVFKDERSSSEHYPEPLGRFTLHTRGEQ